jgi:hypothetical protein
MSLSPSIDDIDCDRLKEEWAMVPDFFQAVIHEKEMGRAKKITKISMMIDILNGQPIGKKCFINSIDFYSFI